MKLDAPVGSNIYLCAAPDSWSQIVSLDSNVAHANPPWIASLAWNKITGAPAFVSLDDNGNLTIPGGVETGDADAAAGSVISLRGVGTAKLGVQGATSGQWDIAAPEQFASWTFTAPPAPCGARQWWTTDSNGAGSCRQPAFADIAGTIEAGQLGGNVSGDLSGSLPAPTVSRINGTTVPASSAADQALVTTAAGAAAWVTLPSCAPSSGRHLNYDPATHTFSCGASAGGGGTVTHTAGELTLNAPVVGNGGADIRSGSATGNTTTFVTSAGARPEGNCAKWDANGNLVDSGGACGSGSGGGGGGSGMIIGGAFAAGGGYQVAAGATKGFMPFGAGAIDAYSWSADWVCPLTGTLSKFFIAGRSTGSGGNNQPADGALTCTIYKAGAASALQIVVAAGTAAASYSDTTHTAAINAGDKMHVRCANAGSSVSAVMNSWGVVLQ